MRFAEPCRRVVTHDELLEAVPLSRVRFGWKMETELSINCQYV